MIKNTLQLYRSAVSPQRETSINLRASIKPSITGYFLHNKRKINPESLISKNVPWIKGDKSRRFYGGGNLPQKPGSPTLRGGRTFLHFYAEYYCLLFVYQRKTGSLVARDIPNARSFKSLYKETLVNMKLFVLGLPPRPSISRVSNAAPRALCEGDTLSITPCTAALHYNRDERYCSCVKMGA